MKNMYLQLLGLQSGHSDLVLATVTGTKGSTPQKPGSSAIFSKDGLIAGTVGGGIVESRVEKLAITAAESGNSGHFTFNLNNDISNKEEAICGGEIKILIDARPFNAFEVLKQLKDSVDNHIPGVLVTMVNRFSEETVLINRYWMTEKLTPEMPQVFIEKLRPVIFDMIAGEASAYTETEISVPDEEPVSKFFLEAIFPAPKLVIAGAGHIGKVLARLGDMLDFEVTVIDDRKEFVNSGNIPGASHVMVMDIGEAMQQLKKGNDTYVVIVTRGHKDDAAALRPCLGSGLAYTGMIGSKTKIASMKADFIGNGWATPEQWDEIYTPIGLDIKSKTVEEIAVSIAAQLILVKNTNKIPGT